MEAVAVVVRVIWVVKVVMEILREQVSTTRTNVGNLGQTRARTYSESVVLGKMTGLLAIRPP
jgi:hypothetical protein